MPNQNTARWTPMLWPPEWTSPDALRLVAGSPIDCLVLPSDSDSSLWKPLKSEAQRAGLSVRSAPPHSVRSIEDGVWPKVATRGDSDAVDAGPTGLPWIDSNGWRIQLAQALFPDKTPWARFDPPGTQQVVRTSAYQVAVADCEAYGGRWVISLDQQLRAGLVQRDGAALMTWQGILGTLSFFRQQAPAPGTHSPGVMGALSDFSGDNEILSHEFLNLIAREYVPVRVLAKTGAIPPFDGLRMVVYLDRQPLQPDWRTALVEFVRSGGALVADPLADLALGTPMDPILGLEYELQSLGRGRIAISRHGFEDPWRLAADSHVLLGRERDLLRQSNAGSMNISFVAASCGSARLHLVNYSGRPGLNPVTLTLLDRYRQARFRSLEKPESMQIPVAREYGRSAVYLPPFSVCATLDLET